MNEQLAEDRVKFVSHGAFNSYREALAEAELRVANSAPKNHEELQNLLSELVKFELGRALVVERGLNAYWMQYVISYPQHGKITGLSSDGTPLSKLERWILESAPFVVSAQDRYFNFQKQIVKRLRNEATLGSIPCGYMDDLLGLDYSSIQQFTLVGVDIDPSAIEGARQNAVANNLEQNVILLQRDAWNLHLDAQCDLLVSHGLSIYVSQRPSLVALYKQFFDAIKPGGSIITSFLLNHQSHGTEVPSMEDLALQDKIMSTVLAMKWQACYLQQEAVVEILKEAGFQDIEFHYDRYGIFPTVCATKGQ